MKCLLPGVGGAVGRKRTRGKAGAGNVDVAEARDRQSGVYFRSLVKLQKLDNGKYEVSPARGGGGGRKEKDEGEGRGRERGRGRGERSAERRVLPISGEAAEAGQRKV